MNRAISALALFTSALALTVPVETVFSQSLDNATRNRIATEFYAAEDAYKAKKPAEAWRRLEAIERINPGAPIPSAQELRVKVRIAQRSWREARKEYLTLEALDLTSSPAILRAMVNYGNQIESGLDAARRIATQEIEKRKAYFQKFSYNGQPVYYRGKSKGFMNAGGKFVLESLPYDEGSTFNRGYSKVSKYSKRGETPKTFSLSLINLSGEKVFGPFPRMDHAGSYVYATNWRQWTGLYPAITATNKKVFIFDVRDQKVVSDPALINYFVDTQYDRLTLMTAESTALFSLQDRKVIIPFGKFTSIYSRNSRPHLTTNSLAGYFSVTSKDAQGTVLHGVVDVNGKMVKPLQAECKYDIDYGKPRAEMAVIRPSGRNCLQQSTQHRRIPGKMY